MMRDRLKRMAAALSQPVAVWLGIAWIVGLFTTPCTTWQKLLLTLLLWLYALAIAWTSTL